MSDSIAQFFSAWQITSAEDRRATIASAVCENIQYSDPRTQEPITTIDALSDYIGEFSANAPGWSAHVVAQDTITGTTRATIAFGGPGPDGKTAEQLGQYFVEFDGEQITRMVGFAGTGSRF